MPESSRYLFLKGRTGRYPSALAAVAGSAALAALWLTWAPARPVADYGWRQSAEWWRCLTCHFVHLGAWHLFLNLAALAGLAAVARLRSAPGAAVGFAAALLAGMLGVCLGLNWRAEGVTWYVGLSGALYGVFAWTVLGLAGWRHWPGRAAWAIYLLGLAKALADAGMPVGAPGLAGIPLAPSAHLDGLLGGTVWAGMNYLTRLRRAR